MGVVNGERQPIRPRLVLGLFSGCLFQYLYDPVFKAFTLGMEKTCLGRTIENFNVH